MANRCGGSIMERRGLGRLVKNVKRQAGGRAALTACLFTHGIEGLLVNEDIYGSLVCE